VNPDTKDKIKTLTDQDIVAQTAIILIAGQETTACISLTAIHPNLHRSRCIQANSLAFCPLALARHPDFQDKVRAKIYANFAAIATDLVYEICRSSMHFSG
jgi:cytochrome P450